MEKYTILALVYLILAVMQSGIQVAYVIKRDTNAVQKYMRVAAPAVYLVAFSALLVSFFFLMQDKTYILHILLGVVMLVALPATIFSTSVATIIGGNIVE